MINGKYNEKIDEWACGILLYQMLIGKYPFRGETDDEILSNIKEGNFDQDLTLLEEISCNAKDLIYKLLQQNPDERISSGEALKHKWFNEFSELNVE